MSQIKLKSGDINIGEPIAWNCFDRAGVLLLRNGQIIESAKQLEMLMNRGIFYNDEVCEPVRQHVVSAFDLLNEVHQKLRALYAEMTAIENNLRYDILLLCEKIQQVCGQDTDAAIGNILLNTEYKYVVRHPVNVAIVCEIIAKSVKWTHQERLPLLAAALTMNIGMIRTQEILYYQKGKLSDDQKQDIFNHPRHSMEILMQAGVADKIWLKGVAHHHEAIDGSGYPLCMKGNLIPLCAKIVSVADHYCAAISSRAYRRSLTSQESMKDVYLSAGQKTDPEIANVCVRALGVYPPGTVVKLVNDEIAVVIRRGEKAHTPVVRCVINANQECLFQNPVARDSSKEEFFIKEIADIKDKVKIDLQLLWGYRKMQG